MNNKKKLLHTISAVLAGLVALSGACSATDGYSIKYDPVFLDMNDFWGVRSGIDSKTFAEFTVTGDTIDVTWNNVEATDGTTYTVLDQGDSSITIEDGTSEYTAQALYGLETLPITLLISGIDENFSDKIMLSYNGGTGVELVSEYGFADVDGDECSRSGNYLTYNATTDATGFTTDLSDFKFGIPSFWLDGSNNGGEPYEVIELSSDNYTYTVGTFEDEGTSLVINATAIPKAAATISINATVNFELGAWTGLYHPDSVDLTL